MRPGKIPIRKRQRHRTRSAALSFACVEDDWRHLRTATTISSAYSTTIASARPLSAWMPPSASGCVLMTA